MTCSKCGACCTHIVLKPMFMDKDIEEHYKARGCEIEDNVVKVPFPCPKLKDNMCTLYDKRPALCRQYNGQTTGFYRPKECTI